MLFELPPGVGGDPWEESALERRVDFQSLATAEGAEFKAMALDFVCRAGAELVRLNFEIDHLPVDAELANSAGEHFLLLARGTPDPGSRSGLRRTDTVEKVGFMAMQLRKRQSRPILIVTSDLPTRRGSKAGRYLAALSDDVWDVVATRADLRGFHRLQALFSCPLPAAPPPAAWRSFDIPNDHDEALDLIFDDQPV